MLKKIDKAVQILAAVFGLAALFFFFFSFVNFEMASGNVSASGMQLAFGGKLNSDLGAIAKSGKFLFVFWVGVLSLILSISAVFKKSAKLTYWNSGFAVGTAIYMLVAALGKPYRFVDTRPFTDEITGLSYAAFLYVVLGALILSAVFAVVHMFTSDKIAVQESGGTKLPLLKRVFRFFKDYRGETKKIVWPGFKEVLKNTLIVLIMCVVIGVIIWLADWGLGSLLKLVWGK